MRLQFEILNVIETYNNISTYFQHKGIVVTLRLFEVQICDERQFTFSLVVLGDQKTSIVNFVQNDVHINGWRDHSDVIGIIIQKRKHSQTNEQTHQRTQKHRYTNTESHSNTCMHTNKQKN